MTDRFKSYARGLAAPAVASFAIVPSDTADLAETIRLITLNAGGTLRWAGLDGVINNTGPLPAGSYAISAVRIHATGTTATGLTGWV